MIATCPVCHRSLGLADRNGRHVASEAHYPRRDPTGTMICSARKSAKDPSSTEDRHMSFADAFKKNPQPHVDTPAQAEARAKAAAEIQAKADAKAARATEHKPHSEPEKVDPVGAGPVNPKT